MVVNLMKTIDTYRKISFIYVTSGVTKGAVLGRFRGQMKFFSGELEKFYGNIEKMLEKISLMNY